MNERAKLLHSLTIERADTRVSPPRRRLWPVVAATSLGVVVVMAGLVWYFAPELASLRPVEQAAAVAPVSSPPSSATAAAAEATRSGGLVASGYVVARRKATVASEITGKVVEVLVDEGNVVQAGDLLARLDSTLTESDLNLAKSRAVASEAAANAIAADLRDAERILVNKINFTQPLPVAYANRIRGIDGVANLTHANWFGGYFQDPKNFLIVFAVEPETYMDLYSDDLDFPAEARRAFVRDRSGAMVGETLARKRGWKVGDHIPISSQIFSQKKGARTWDFTIDGIFTSRTLHVDTNFMIFQYDYFDETRSFAKDMIGWIVLRTASPSMNDQVAKAVDKMFANSSYETSTDTEKAFNKAFAAQLGNIALIVELVVGAAFATILMIVGNSMIMAVRERTREIGVLKTLGFTGARVLRLVLGESVLLALMGGIPGLLVAFIVTWWVRDSLSNFVPGMTLTPGIALAAVALMIGLGIVTGLLPALNAFRLRIAAALGRG